MAHGNRDFAHSNCACGLYKRHLAQHQRVGADHACNGRNEGDRDRDDGILNRRTKRSRHHQREDEQRQRLQHVHQALRDQVEPSAEIAGAQPGANSEQAAERGRSNANRKRDPCAEDNAAPHVSAHEIGSQQVHTPGPGQRIARAGAGRIECRDPAGKNCHQHDREHDRGPGGAERIAVHKMGERPPERGAPSRAIEFRLLIQCRQRLLRSRGQLSYLIRGSSIAYAISMRKFTLTTTTAMNITRLCTTG